MGCVMAEHTQVCRAAGVPLIVNDRVDVALAAGPDVGGSGQMRARMRKHGFTGALLATLQAP